jgi:hypothetical protein
MVPGVPAAGHRTSGGGWHPGQIDGCVKCPPPPGWSVLLRRADGRLVRAFPARSKYHAKQVRTQQDARHGGDRYYTEICRPDGTVLPDEPDGGPR